MTQSVVRRRTYAGGLRSTDLIAAARTGAKLGKWAGQMFSKRRNNGPKRETPSGNVTQNPVTFQRDVITTYKRRPAPRRVRKRAARRQMQFESSLARTLGLKSLVTNSYPALAIPTNGQGFLDIPFVNAATMAKMFGAFQVDGTIGQQTTFTPNQPTVEIIVKSYRCEVEINNSATILMYIDLYYYYPRKDYTTNVGDLLLELASVPSQTSAQISNTNVVTSPSTFNTIGMTPFNVPSFTENFVVYRTRRVMLQPGQSFTFSQNARKMGNQSNRDWINMTVRRNITTGVVIVASGAVVSNGTGTGILNMHKQEWISGYKNGGLGSQSTVVNYPGQ